MPLMRRNGVWYLRIKVGGTPYWRSTGFKVGGKADLIAARRRASEIELEIRSGKAGFVKPTVPTFGEAAQVYIDSTLKPSKHPRSGKDDMERSLVVWRGKKLDTITENDCQALVATWKAKYKRGTIRMSIIRAKTIFSRAVKQGVIATNPWADIRLPRPESRTRVLTLDEQRKVAEYLKGSLHGMPLVRLFKVMIGTGLRIFEAQKFVLKDVDFKNHQIRVIGKYDKRRIVPLHPDVERLLREQIADREVVLARKVKFDDQLFWMRSTRKRKAMQSNFYHNLVRRFFMQAASALEIEPFAPHDCRRTFGTRCAESGVPMKTLQRWMGHADIKTTAEYYVHLDNDETITRPDFGLAAV